MTDAEIVAALAICSEPWNHGWSCCALCGHGHGEGMAGRHDPDCPWRMARELLGTPDDTP